ncbi:MAG: chromate transporter [Lachnospiraceae bacterium]|nr:chromate transporter [Lachnospiraceae bacterium]
MILLELFLTFLKTGAFTFGGGYAMLPIIQREVLNHGWLSKSELIDFIAVSESTPGPFAINMATFVGIRTFGLTGSLLTTFGVILPSFVIILIVAKCYDGFKKSRAVKGIMAGLKPAMIGMIGTAIILVGSTVFFPDGFALSSFSRVEFYTALTIFAISLILAFKKIHPIAIIILSAVLGIISGYL